MRERDWKWIISILVGIIVFILSYKFWGKPGDLTNIISIGSGLVSIALAIVAIIMAVAEGIKSSNKEEKVQVGLDEIITNTKTMRDLIHKLEKDIFNTRKQLSSFEQRFTEKYAKDIQSFNQLDEKVNENKDNNHKKQTQPKDAEVNQEEKEKVTVVNIKNSHSRILKRGDIFFANLSPVVGSEQGGVRPVLVVSNDIANRFSPVITIAPITAEIQKAKLPTHVEIDSKRWGLKRDSVILAEQTKSIDKSRLTDKITYLDDDMMDKVDAALSVQLGLIDF